MGSSPFLAGKTKITMLRDSLERESSCKNVINLVGSRVLIFTRQFHVCLVNKGKEMSTTNLKPKCNFSVVPQPYLYLSDCPMAPRAKKGR